MYEFWCGGILRDVRIQNESKQIVATSVSKAVT